MKAIILSAGFGTRLGSYTEHVPKALVHYKNLPMISYRIEELKRIGIKDIIINAHHHSEKIVDYFSRNNFDVKINIIIEDQILGTGGGILNAASFFKDEDYFLVINVDIHTDMDILKMIKYQEAKKAFATLAIQKRNTTRPLEFDSEMKLVGTVNEKSEEKNLYAFNGIHIISNRIFKKGFEIKFMGIFEIYFKVINREDEIILGYDVGESTFKDLGKIENLL